MTQFYYEIEIHYKEIEGITIEKKQWDYIGRNEANWIQVKNDITTCDINPMYINQLQIILNKTKYDHIGRVWSNGNHLDEIINSVKEKVKNSLDEKISEIKDSLAYYEKMKEWTSKE